MSLVAFRGLPVEPLPQERGPSGTGPDDVIETDITGTRDRGLVGTLPPAFQLPGSDVIFVDETGGPAFVGVGLTRTVLEIPVPAARQLRVYGLAALSDELGISGLVRISLLRSGNPLAGFSNIYPVGSISSPFRTWCNVIGPATFGVAFTNNGPQGQGVSVSTRVLGWLYAEVSTNARRSAD